MRARSLYRLLLLLCSLAVTDAVKCDISLVKGVLPEEIILMPDRSNASIKRLYCRSSDTTLKRIMFNSKSLKQVYLECDEVNGWREGNDIINDPTLAAADAPLTVSCKEYCAVKGAGLEVATEPAGNGYPNFSYGLYVSCSDAHFSQLMYKGQRMMSYGRNNAYCGQYGWDRDLDGHPSNTEPQEGFACITDTCSRSIPQVTSQTNPKSNGPELYDFNTNTLTCEGTERSLSAIEFKSTWYESLKCDEAMGWIGGNQKIADTSSRLHFNCVNYCESNGEGIAVEKIGANAIISCSKPTSKLFHNGRYVAGHASCNLDGWKMFDFIQDRQGNASTPQQFECTADPTTTTTTTTTDATATRRTTRSPRVIETAAPLNAENEEDDGDYTILIMIGCSIGAFVLGIVAAVTIAKLFCADNMRPEQGQSSRKSREDGGRKRECRGDDKNRDDVDSVSTEV